MDRLLSMRVFQRVIDEGGFATAARAMDMSPAVVTRLVNDLEEHLGARLLHRTTRSLSLTDAGQSYLGRLRHILLEVEDAESAATANTQELQGTLHLLATPTLASYLLAPCVAQWRERFPKVYLDIAVDNFPASRVEEFDLSFLILDDGYDSTIVARALVQSEWIVCAASSYERRAGTPESPADLQTRDYLRYMAPVASAHHGKNLRLHCHDKSVPPVDLASQAVLQTESMDALLRATLEGAGFAVLSKVLVAPYLARGDLVHWLPDWTMGGITVYAALPTRKLVPARTRAFLDFLSEFRAPERRYTDLLPVAN